MGAAGPGVTAVDTVQTAVRDKQRDGHGGGGGQGEERAHTHNKTVLAPCPGEVV